MIFNIIWKKNSTFLTKHVRWWTRKKTQRHGEASYVICSSCKVLNKKKSTVTGTIFKNVGVPNDSHAVVFSNCCFSSTVPSDYALKTTYATLSLYFLFFILFFTSTWGLSTQLHQAIKNRSQPIHILSNTFFFFFIAMLSIFLFLTSMILCFVYLFPSNIHHGSYLEPNILAFETKLCFVFVVALKSRTSTS